MRDVLFVKMMCDFVFYFVSDCLVVMNIVIIARRVGFCREYVII